MFKALAVKLLLAMSHTPTFAVATTDGRVAVVAHDGTLRAESPGPFVDVAADPGDADAFWALAPGGEEPGALVRFRLGGGTLVREEERPFDAPSGALLSGGGEPLVLVISEGSSLDLGGHGRGVGLVASGGAAGRVAWTFLPYPSPRVLRFTLGPEGIVPLDETEVPAGADVARARVVATRDGWVVVGAGDGAVRLVGSEHSAPTDGWVLEAKELSGGRVVALVGEAPRLVSFDTAGAAHVVGLPGGPLPLSAALVHRLAEGGSDETWVALDDRIARVVGAADVAELPVPASAIARLR